MNKALPILCFSLLLSGCTTSQVNKSLSYVFPYSNGNMPSVHSTPVYGRVTVSDSKGNSTTYKISGYVR